MRATFVFAFLAASVACEHEPPDLSGGHIELEGVARTPSFSLRAREYGYGLVDASKSLRVRIVLPRNQAVAKAFIIAGPVRIDLSGSLITSRGERLRMDVVPSGIHLIEESGRVAHTLRVNWPNARSVSVFDRENRLVGTAKEATPPANADWKSPGPPGEVTLESAQGEVRGRIRGLPARAAALFLLKDLDDLERCVLAIYLIRFR